jgi:hypothetical protein
MNQPATAQPELRASDAERDEVIDRLRRHCAEGRISIDELSERIDAVYAARTRTELAPPLRDLPSEPPLGASRVPDRDRTREMPRTPAPPFAAPLPLVALAAVIAAASVSGAWWLLWLMWPLIHWTKAPRRVTPASPAGALGVTQRRTT